MATVDLAVLVGSLSSHAASRLELVWNYIAIFEPVVPELINMARSKLAQC